MKNKIGKSILAWLLVISMALPMLPSGVIAKAADTQVTVDYEALSIKELLAKKDNLTWVFAGDSITHNASWTQGMNSYSEWFEQYLYDIGRGDDAVINTAWGGADIRDFQTEANTPNGSGSKEDPGQGLEKMITSYNPDVVFIKLGMNDRGRTTNAFVEYYNKMLDSLYEQAAVQYHKKPKVIIITPTTLIGENIYDDMAHPESEETVLGNTMRFRNALETIASERGLMFCDFRTPFIKEAVRLGEDYAQTFFSDPSDGNTHPNMAGQYFMFQTLMETLELYDETNPIFQLTYEDLDFAPLYVDTTDGVNYSGNYGSTEGWNRAVTENYVWTVAGAEQMAGYEGPVVNRSLFRFLDNAMRGGSGTSSQRDIRMINAAAPEYTLDSMLENYDSIIGKHNTEVFLLLPEVMEVYGSEYSAAAHIEKVAKYKENVQALLNKNQAQVKILWTPLASGDDVINGYLNDYAEAVREVANANAGILFFDANKFMNDNMNQNSVLKRNWFAQNKKLSPLGASDLAIAFYKLMNQSGIASSELSDHNLRLTSDKRVFKGTYVYDYIAANTQVSGKEVSIDIAPITSAYSGLTNIRMVVLPYANAGNYNKNLRLLDEVATVSQSGTVYTFEAPCKDLHLAIYADKDGYTYRFQDISLEVEGAPDKLPERQIAEPDGVYLNLLNVVGAPEINFDKDTTTYDVTLYQYQQFVYIQAEAQEGLTIIIDGKQTVSGELSEMITVDDQKTISVVVSKGTESKTYTLHLTRPGCADIIITEVMTDGYWNETVSGNDNYELIEIYNASGRDLNLADYAIGHKKDYPYNKVDVTNGEYPYYFTGNNQSFTGAMTTHTGVKVITKYSQYWEDGSVSEPESIPFPADSTMVIWNKFATQTTPEARKTYSQALTYDTLIAALKKYQGTHTLSVDIDGTDTPVVPFKSQLVVAEAATDSQAGGLTQQRSKNRAEKSQQNFYLDSFGSFMSNGTTRGWLYILKDTAMVASNGTITEAGNDIISAAKYIRPGDTQKLSSVFSYNTERGMSLVKNEAVVDTNLIGRANISEQSGYSNLTSFGAIEYWQKPADVLDSTAPSVTDWSEITENTLNIDLKLEDDTDIRYMELHIRQSDGSETLVKKDFVLEAGVKNQGKSEDITATRYCQSVAVTDENGEIRYWGYVVDGNGNQTMIGSESESVSSKCESVAEEYPDISEYRGEIYTAPAKEGYVFAGWYTDEECKTPIEKGVKTGSGFAKFVPDHVLRVKTQVSANLLTPDPIDDTQGAIRFVTSVDSLQYNEAGFYITVGGTENIYSNNKVYGKLFYINTDGTGVDKDTEITVTPDNLFCQKSKYFKTQTFVNIPSSQFDVKLTVVPFWETLDGTIVRGDAVTRCVNDGRNVGSYVVTSYEELKAALADIENRDAADEITIKVAGDFEIPETVTINTGRNITLLNDAEVEAQTVKIYRGLGLANADMFFVAKGATLTIRGAGNNNSFVLDGRTEAEAKAETAKESAAGSSGSLISNYGNLTIDNITVQYVKKNAGTGGVINHNADNKTNADAMVTIRNSVFDNNSSASYGSVLYSRAKAVITGSTFTNNSANANGGVLCNHNGTLFTVDSCDFSHNAGKEGGVIWTNTASLITGSTFEANVGTSGGAIRIGGNNVEVENSSFIGNQATVNGGAIYNSGTNFTLTNTVFENNTADGQGGAVGNHGKSATLTDCKFVGNTAKMSGGGFYSGSSSEVIIRSGEHSEKAVFENNRANTAGTEYGGGAICIGSGNLTVENYTFKGNTTEVTTDNDGQGGGAIRMNAASSTLQVNGCTFDANTSKSCGGAISNKASMTIKNSTFSENNAKKGGAVYNHTGTMTLTGIDTVSAVFKDNTATENGGAIYLAGGTLNGSGYEFVNNTPNHIYVAGGTNNYKEYTVSTYEELQAAVTDIANLKTTNAVYIKVADSFEFTDTITIPAECNIAIEDDGLGTVKTLTKTKAANMFVMSKGATLTLRSSGSVDEPKLIVDGANVTTNSPVIYAAASSNCNINVLEGVQFTNHKSTGNGSVIRLDNNAGTTLKIDGAKFDHNDNVGYAGTIYVRATSTAEIKNSVFGENTSSGGSAIWSEGNVKLTIDTCTFENNTAQKVTPYTNWVDGTVYIYQNTQAAIIKNSTFTGNTGDQNGGTIIVYQGKADITDSTFTGNSSVKGAAILNGRSTLTVDGCTFNENVATTQGGAICNEGTASANGTATITNSTFTGNVAKNGNAFGTSNLGGAISNTANCTMSVTDSTFTGNQAYRGGAIYNVGNLTLTGTGEKALFQGNTASNWGGAVYTEGGTFNADGYMFAENKGAYGGAILMFTASNVSNSTFRGNEAISNEGSAVYLHAGTLNGSGYEFTSDNTLDVRQHADAVNNYAK